MKARFFLAVACSLVFATHCFAHGTVILGTGNPPDWWGTGSWVYGYSKNHKTPAEARAAAMGDFRKNGGKRVVETRDPHDTCFTLYVIDRQHRIEFATLEVGSTIAEANKLASDECMQKGGNDGVYSCNQVTKACDQSSLIAQSQPPGSSSSSTLGGISDIITALGESRYGWQLVAVPESSGSALEKCASLGWASCRRIGTVPPGACAAYATTPDGLTYRFGDGADLGDAKRSALDFCRPSDRDSKCEVRWGQCNVGAPVAFTASSVDETYFSTKPAAPQQPPPTLVQPAAPPPKASAPPLSPADTAQPTPIPPQSERPPLRPTQPLREAQNVAPPPAKPPIAIPQPAPTMAPTPPPIQQAFTPIVLKETGLIEFRYLNYLSVAILAVLFMWFLWAFSIRTPPNVLHTYLLVAAWTAVPLIIALGVQILGFDGSPQRYVWNLLAPAFVQLYAAIYLLLYLGNRLRMTVFPHDTENTDHVFLRLPALTVVIPIALALYLAQHQFKTDTEFAICSLLTLAVFGIGYFIRPYRVSAPAGPALQQLSQEVTARASIEPVITPAPVVETVPVRKPQAAIELPSEVTEVGAVPANNLPAIIQQPSQVLQPMPPLEGIVLKLKRSQKTGAMGGITYMLDARIDASQETLSLIAKHNLGNRLIYESEARQKHAATAQGHLAATRGGPSLLAPASEQAKGAAGTIWKLGRAAVSAVRASLALRITVDSLLSGVHVECKSMEELLEAEAAIREAKGNLEGFLETAQTFDGREEIH